VIRSGLGAGSKRSPKLLAARDYLLLLLHQENSVKRAEFIKKTRISAEDAL
jgi:hypothetical protein